MNRVLVSLFSIFCLLLFSAAVFAQTENTDPQSGMLGVAAATSCPDPANLCADYAQKILNQAKDLNGKPYPEFFWERRNLRQKQEWEWSLPFMAQKAIDKGFGLPRPYGFSMVFFHQDQGINLGDLQVAFKPDVGLKNIDFVKFSNAHIENYTWQAKLDAWILPFLNVFGIVGVIKGSGNVPVSIAAKDVFSSFGIDICDGVGSHTPAFCQSKISYDAPVNYTGTNWGVGFLLAGGYENYFFAMPVTYAQTKVNVTDEPTTALNLTPRIGYNWATEVGKLGAYLGANYQQTHIVLAGSYLLPLAGTEIGQDVPVRYQIKESPMDLWNAVAGLNWEISQHLSLVVEIGYSENRENQTFVMNYRF